MLVTAGTNFALNKQASWEASRLATRECEAARLLLSAGGSPSSGSPAAPRPVSSTSQGVRLIEVTSTNQSRRSLTCAPS